MTVTQLQLHYTTTIHERAAKVLIKLCGTPFTDDAKNIVDFEKLCVVSAFDFDRIFSNYVFEIL